MAYTLLPNNTAQRPFRTLPRHELVEKNSSACGHRLCGNLFCSDNTVGGVKDKTFGSGVTTVATEGMVCVWGRLLGLVDRDREGKEEATPLVLFAEFCESVTGVARPLMLRELEAALLNSLAKDSPSVETMLMLELKFIELLPSNRFGFFGDGKNTSGRYLWRVRPRVVVLNDSDSDIMVFGFSFTDASSSVRMSDGGGAGVGVESFKNVSSISMLSSCCTTSRLRSLP